MCLKQYLMVYLCKYYQKRRPKIKELEKEELAKCRQKKENIEQNSMK